MLCEIAIAHINHAMNDIRSHITELENDKVKNKAKIKKLESQMNKLYSAMSILLWLEV